MNLAKKILPTLFCALAVLLSACGGGGNAPQTSATTKAPDDQQIYISPLGGYADIKTFDPAIASDIPSINSIYMLFTGLVQLDDKLQVKDQLAASHQLGADNTTWTFKLKDGLKFSDGSALTSADVAYSIDRALQPATKSGSAPFYLGLIKDSDKLNSGKIKTIINDSLLTPDPQTIVIKTQKPSAYFLQSLTYPSAYVISKALLQKYGNAFVDHLTDGVGGTGPWKLSKYTRGKSIEFVPNPNYYGARPQLKKVIMPFYREGDTTYQAYQANQVDTASIPNSQLDSARALPNRQFHQAPLLWTYYYGMNYLIKPFDNIKIRQAFALAIDKDMIAHNIQKDTVIATNHFIPRGMPGYYEGLKGPAGVQSTRGDPTMAKKLLEEGMKEAGYTKANFPPITITIATKGAADARNQMSAVQQMWKTVLGIDVRINDMDFSTYFDQVDNTRNNPKGLQMWIWDWVADYADPQDWVTLLYDKGASKNSMNYGQNSTPAAAEQQATQKLMEEADGNPDQAGRMQQYNEIEQKLVNDVVSIPLYQETSVYIQKPCVVGVVDNAQGLTPPDDWGKIYKTTAMPCADTSKYK